MSGSKPFESSGQRTIPCTVGIDICGIPLWPTVFHRIRHNYQVLFLKFFGGSCSPREVPSLLLKHQKMHGHRRSFIPNTWSLYLQRTKKKPVSVKKLEPFRERQQSTGTNTSQNTAKQNRCQDNQKGRAAKHRTQAVPMCHASHWPEKKRF
jgi:hypothetical protein